MESLDKVGQKLYFWVLNHLSMTLVDTHTHLYVEEFANDRTEVIERAIEAGVKHFVLPAIEQKYTHSMLELKQSFPNNIYVMMGLHPCYVKENYQEELDHVHQQLLTRNYVAVGEIGIDLYWDKTTLEIQKIAFEQQIAWAIALDLPIVIHSRESTREILEILQQKKHPQLRGIFHCFSGTLEEAQEAVALGFYLGIGGVVTFKNGKIDTFLNQLPLEKLVLETDAPYLAPVPYRGKRNESSYTVLVAEKLAQLYQTSIEEIAKITTENAFKIFKINQS